MPVIGFDLVEIKRYVDRFGIGICIEHGTQAAEIAECISALTVSEFEAMKLASIKFNNEVNWENEFRSVANWYRTTEI